MKHKRLLFLLALLMTAATGAWAQQTLTVYDGTFYDNYSPANICYIDEFTRSQTVIPSTALTAMKGCDITAMKFYSNSIAASGTIDYYFDVYLKEVSYTAFDESPTFEPKSSCTSVHQGKLSISNFELTITFSKPFHYNGGNLLLGMENTSIVTYYDITFVGRDTGSSLSNISIHHKTDLASATKITERYFIPKTTFTYVVPTYTVKLADGTQDAKNWTITSGENSATGDAADGLTGLSKKDAVTLTYGGRLKVKSVTATTDAEPPAPVEGKFTINANGDQVNFAKGNLQAKTEDYGATWTWGFAEHQYDYIGNNVANTTINGNGTVSTNGTVDLFGWVGTSGNLEGIAEYGISNVGYETAADAYGYQTNDQLKHDWGELIGDGKTWRVLTAAEWDYITNKRKDKQGSDVDRYAKATVNGVPGLILFPDEYEHVVTPPTNINVISSAAKFGDNQYDLTAWTLMENAGCIFLPASSSRNKAVVTITTNYEKGIYWTSTPHKTQGDCSYVMRFDYKNVSSAITENSARYYGNAVRLVKSATDVLLTMQSLTIAKGSTGLSEDKVLYYMPGDTYRQALARTENQSTGGLGWSYWEDSSLTTLFFKEVTTKAWDVAIDGDSNFGSGKGTCTITLDTEINPTGHTFQFVTTQ